MSNIFLVDGDLHLCYGGDEVRPDYANGGRDLLRDESGKTAQAKGKNLDIREKALNYCITVIRRFFRRGPLETCPKNQK